MASAAALLDGKVEGCVDALGAWLAKERECGRLLSADARAFCSPTTLRRYAVARNGDVRGATDNLLDTLKWREGAVPPSLHCPACDRDARMHCFFPIGVDERGRVVVYASMARAMTNEREVTVGHMVHTLEHAFKASEALGLHHQWVWIVDFNGFGLRHAMQASTSTATLSTFSTHFPERLGAVLLVNPPGLFDMLLAVVKTVADARTLSKVHIVHVKPADAAREFAAHGIAPGTGMSAWLGQALALPPTPGSLPPLDVLDKGHLAALTLPRVPPA